VKYTFRARAVLALLARSRSPRAIAYASVISPSTVLHVAMREALPEIAAGYLAGRAARHHGETR
jgi:hypothetical protein